MHNQCLTFLFLKKKIRFLFLCARQKSSAHGWVAARADVKEEAATRWAYVSPSAWWVLCYIIRGDYVCLATFGFLSLLEGRKTPESPFDLRTHWLRLRESLFQCSLRNGQHLTHVDKCVCTQLFCGYKPPGFHLYKALPTLQLEPTTGFVVWNAPVLLTSKPWENQWACLKARILETHRVQENIVTNECKNKQQN